jgi:ATP-dependent Clp protease protease subunit
MLYTKRMFQERIAYHTGQTQEQIEADFDRDRWFTADEAKDYGFIDNDVSTVAMGMAASMGQFLLCAGKAGKRFALPHTRVMMHQPSGGIGGSASDIAIQAEQMLYTKKLMQERIAFHTGQTVEQIESDSDRDRWFTAEEAQQYGLIDLVLPSTADVATTSV